MKFNLILILIFISSCVPNYTKLENREAYNSKGFALIFNEQDYNKKFIRGKLDNNLLEIAHPNLRVNSLIKIINVKTNDSIILKNTKNIKYPDFYKILITESVADRLSIDRALPLVEIIEIKKNKSFIAKKAKIYSEEKKISSNAPVTSVEISNISKNKKIKQTEKDEMYILIASFYSKDTAEFLKKRITKELPQYNIRKLKIIKKKDTKINLISGPYYAVNFMKNDYIELKKFGFEELNIILNE